MLFIRLSFTLLLLLLVSFAFRLLYHLVLERLTGSAASPSHQECFHSFTLPSNQKTLTRIQLIPAKLVGFSELELQFTSDSLLLILTNGALSEVLCRFLLVDSLDMTAYGFIDANYDIRLNAMNREAGSICFLIPQIELNEYESFSILTGTLAWGDSVLCNFKQALHSYERSLSQAIDHIPPLLELSHSNFMKPTNQNFDLVKDEKLLMFYMEALLLGGCDNVAASMEMKGSSLLHFFIRMSVQTAFSTNRLDHNGSTSSFLQHCANINSLWAFLIVEELSRLGLTYFCIAPGSRSSPLAVAASSHHRITCTTCYDERSLAFHALGYARGSQIPAVVITTSGTAVSNLFPAVVEASQDFVPLVLLTADRPPELLAAGANQAIDQVNHFGSYVRFFFNLPAPTDHITARMILTTVDSSVHWATCSPYGPVHLNCPFREPLENIPRDWNKSVLDKLDSWNSNAQPFTKYINMQFSYAPNNSVRLTSEVKRVILNSEHGLLVVGAIHREEEMWAALILARHLSWPIVADILSGLRLRKLLTSSHEYAENFVFLDHFDHMLLCDSARQWAELDVIIQVGSKITSKRVSQFLERCFPCSYIMVDNHPCRHDPSHIVTHRVQSTISHFASCLLEETFPISNREWSSYLKAVDSAVAWALSFQISSECSLTEPYVAHALSEVLVSETALFIGNSMPIRDADMYSLGVMSCTDKTLQFPLPCQWMRVVGNRGASGIDGLLSTAIGFSIGSKKRTLCVIGDVSFLHDTNGLAILSSRLPRKPLTVLVINNQGGGIFSLLPIAERTEPQIMEKYFYYNHCISISKLCDAHGIKHMLAETKLDLQNALLISQHADADYVIEVASSIKSNTAFHSILRKCASEAAFHTFCILPNFSGTQSAQGDFIYKIDKLEYSLYGVPLSAPLTSLSVKSGPSNFLRRGFILALTLEDGSTGFGEIAPIEIHKEDLQDVEEQLRFFLHVLKGATITYHLPLLGESFSLWIWKTIGVPPCSIYPSVRCGLEMAVLNAIAARKRCTLLNLLWPEVYQGSVICDPPSGIDICALVDSGGTPQEVANVAFGLVREGFRAVKVKVARRADPRDDAEVIKEIRRKIGDQVELRVDANRKWSYEKATAFGSLVRECGLQYIEEPVDSEDDIVKFCEETGLPVALDETIDNIQGNVPNYLSRFSHPGIVALVIKPSVVGGFENAAAIALWAHIQGKLAVISATFESSLGLSSYVQFACYLEMRGKQTSLAIDKGQEYNVSHGLGTYKWLQDDVTLQPLLICRKPDNQYVGASICDADRVLRNFQMNYNAILESSIEDCMSTNQLIVEIGQFSYSIKVRETGESSNSNILLFLHGFLGTGEDWNPVMKALSGSFKCVSVDLPGHGRSKIWSSDDINPTKGHNLSIEVVASILSKLINKISSGKVTLVGYSMGARIALHMALRHSGMVDGAILISGSPGLEDPVERRNRAAKDDTRAHSLISFGLLPFLDTWYHVDLWKSFREHPSFKKIVRSRSQHGDIHGLAKALSDLSVGRQPSLWKDFKHCEVPLLFIVGERDLKFKNIAQKIRDKSGKAMNYDIVEVPDCGHAVHLENPLIIVRLVREFLTRMKN